ncbi:MAG: hypothetical protein K1X67_00675 [Fimbriimonadaceae bacterium]|nr:hypothetical protein [Fimbriimonadaceae bacterium]
MRQHWQRGLGAMIVLGAAACALAGPPHFEGFEDPGFVSGVASNWNDYNSSLTRVLSGTGGILSRSGAAHGLINSTSLPAPPNDWTGAFTRLGGYSSTFGGGYTASLSVYINLSDPAVVANTYGWDLSTASNTQGGAHRRDFVFHTASNGSGQVLVGASNNSNFTRRNDLGSINHYTITQSGWYTFEWVFRDQAGSLAVDLNLRNDSGVWLWSETRNDPSDLISTIVGGNRYMWFTFLEVDTLAIDDTSVESAASAGMPVDLNGMYCPPFDTGYNSFAGAGTFNDPDRVFELASNVAMTEGSVTPFNEAAGKSPNILTGLNLAGKSFSYDISMGDQSTWMEAQPVDPGYPGGFAEIWTAEDNVAGDYGVYMFWENFGGVYRLVTYDDGGNYTTVYTGLADQTRFRVKTERDMADTTWTFTVTPLDGTGAGTPVAPVAILADAPYFTTTNNFFAVTGYQFSPDDADRRASAFTVSNFTTNAIPNAMYTYADDPYVRTTESIEYRLGMANLAQLTGGYQGFMASSGVQTFASGTYTGVPFSVSSAYDPITAALAVTRGIGFGGSATQSDAKLASLRFNPSAQGAAALGINANNGFGLDTVFADDGTLGSTYAANRRASNVVLVDDVDPTIGAIAASQGAHNVISTSLIKTGTMLICANIADDRSGLDCFPTATLDFAASPDVTVEMTPWVGNLYCAEITVPANQPCDTAVIRIAARDKAGNDSSAASGTLNVNTATVTLTIGHSYPWYLAPMTTITRGIEITVGGTGGSNAPVSLDRNVVFDEDGNATVFLDASDGVPCNGITHISVKDPLHTLRQTVALGGVGNQFTASVSLLGGDMNKDNKVDIGDYVVLAVRYNLSFDPNTPFPHAPTDRHADMNADGEVDIADFSIFAANWGVLGDNLVGNFRPGNPAIRDRISVKDAIAEAGAGAARLDLDRDGWITLKELGR